MGVVKDVLRAQETASGLKIVLQLAHLDPSSPYKTIVVDYDDVVEQRSVKIFTYKTQYVIFLFQGPDIHFWTMQSPEALSSTLQKAI